MGQRLYLLCGLPFSGKSTLSRAIEQRLGIVHVEVDQAHFRHGLVLDGTPLPKEAWITAFREAHEQLEATLDAGKSAVFDATGYRRMHRDRARRFAQARGIPVTVIWMDVSREEAQARREANRVTPKRVNIPDSDFETVARDMQPPQPDEEVVTYHPSEPIDAWIDRVLRPLEGTTP